MLSSDSLKKVFPALRDDSLSMQNRALSSVGGLQTHLAPGLSLPGRTQGYTFHQTPEETLTLPTNGIMLREKQPNQLIQTFPKFHRADAHTKCFKSIQQ